MDENIQLTVHRFFSVSFRRLFGRKGNFSVSVCMVVGIVSWKMKSNISLCMVVGGFIIFL